MSEVITTIGSIRHPFWKTRIGDWTKWRLVYDGGPDFVDKYLESYSTREDNADFLKRKKITPTPNFAKSAVNDIKNAIFQRLVDVARVGGDETYQEAVSGINFGVDLHGASMNSFIGTIVLPELLTMARFGVYVDMPQAEGTTLQETADQRPYVYGYRAEDILSWSFRPGRPDEFDNILLRDFVEIRHSLSGLPSGTEERFRLLFIGEDGKVHVQFFQNPPSDPDVTTSKTPERQVDINGELTDQDIILDLEIIPFVMVELSDSLLADTSNHQIALLNMESSDVAYALLANFPFYTEQQDERTLSRFAKQAGQGDDDGTSATANSPKDQNIQVGATHGRAYAKGMERPAYIHPSPDPLKASMEKQQALKNDIRQLVNLALSNIQPKMASAESKALDERGLEAGLSHIGLVLEHSERKIAKYWAAYLSNADTATVNYPERYSLETDEDRRRDTEQLGDLRALVPSDRFQEIITVQMAEKLIGHQTPRDDMKTIVTEIVDSSAYSSDPKTIFEAVDRGILDLDLAADLLGYPEGTPDKAAKDHAERLARISEAQSRDSENQSENDAGARGIGDLDDTPGRGSEEEKAESRDTTTSGDTGSRVRGEAKL